ncbi:MAG: hypothetical protein GY828_07500, partial [Candidatus Gracilibacteria bacterium]|nr:hypothetical protein [Candidatus Gracilibacteria bacterium]
SFKGGDSSISTRNIFKNTAFYEANLVTDKTGKADISFILPDNLTNFRVMVLSNSKNNYFGYAQEFIEVRKSILIEDKTPLIMRTGDTMSVGANIFNLSEEKQKLKIIFESEGIEISEPSQDIVLKSGEKKFVEWEIKNTSQTEIVNYTIVAQGKSAFFSDKIEKNIPVFESPVLVDRYRKSAIVETGIPYETEIDLPENLDKENSKVELIFSNNRLYGIEKSVNSLLKYPYGCIEQTVSSTYPNAVVKKMNQIFGGIVDDKEIDKNITAGLERIKKMQVADGGFAYWIGETSSNAYISPYVVRTLLDMQDMGVDVDTNMINKAISFLEKQYEKSEDQSIKTEIFWTLAKANKRVWFNPNGKKLSRHELLAYTYGLYYQDPESNKRTIYTNIYTLKNLFQKNQSQHYWNNSVDKALFLQLLLDVGEPDYTYLADDYINDFY